MIKEGSRKRTFICVLIKPAEGIDLIVSYIGD